MSRTVVTFFALILTALAASNAPAQERAPITNTNPRIGEGRLILQYLQYSQDRERLVDELSTKNRIVASTNSVLDSIIGRPQLNDSANDELSSWMESAKLLLGKLGTLQVSQVSGEIKSLSDRYDDIEYDFGDLSFSQFRVSTSFMGSRIFSAPPPPEPIDPRAKVFIDESNKKIQEISQNRDLLDFNNACLLTIQLAAAVVDSTDQNSTADAFKVALGNCVNRYHVFEITYRRLVEEYNSVLADTTTKSSELKSALSSEIKTIEDRISEVSTKIAEFQKYTSDQLLAEQGLIIDPSAQNVILMTLIAWTVIIGLIVGSTIFILRAYSNNSNTSAGENFSFSLFLEMMTVFLLTGTILILGISNKIQTEGLAALIGGISGYVLGKMHSGRQQSAAQQAPNGETAS